MKKSDPPAIDVDIDEVGEMVSERVSSWQHACSIELERVQKRNHSCSSDL